MARKDSYLAVAALALFAGVVCGGEFQVNTHTSNKQENPAGAMDADGDFVVVWNSYLQDGSSNGIFGRRFDANCVAIGEEFQVNNETGGNQREPSVAMDAWGNFVVVWYGPGEDEEDIFVRRFDANGPAIGGEFTVNSRTGDRQLYPSVAMNNGGDFVIVWESANITVQGNRAICGRRYDSNGLSAGEEFVISEGTSDSRYPDVAMDDGGNFAVVWMLDRSSNSIMVRLFGADGRAKGESFEISTIKISSVTRPSVAMDTGGNFVVVWDGDPERASEDDICARLFDANGAALGEQFVVNTTLTGPQQNPQVAMDSRGLFVIVWDSKIDPDVNEREIFGQRYDSAGVAIGDEFQVNSHMEGDQKRPAVAMREGRKFVTAWQSYGQDGSGYGIFGQMGQMAGSADFNSDRFVDFRDYCILAGEWLKRGDALAADLIDDKKINERDLAEFCEQWLTSGY